QPSSVELQRQAREGAQKQAVEARWGDGRRKIRLESSDLIERSRRVHPGHRLAHETDHIAPCPQQQSESSSRRTLWQMQVDLRLRRFAQLARAGIRHYADNFAHRERAFIG